MRITSLFCGLGRIGTSRTGATLIAGILGLILSAVLPARAAEPTALGGLVSSDSEGSMEGVLVSAKRVGGTITITVVSDKEGKYSFPAGRLSAGSYRLSIRAVGYDMV